VKQHNVISGIFIALITLFLIMPIITTIIFSFVTGWIGIAPSGFTFEYYERAVHDVQFWTSIVRGLTIAIVPILISGLFVLMAIYSSLLYFPKLEKYIQSICMIPHTLQGIILAISILSLYAGSPTPFGNRIVMLTCVYSIIILPYVYQGLRNNLHAININQLIEAAEILGAGKMYAFFRIVVPNMLSGITVSALLGLSVIFCDYLIVRIIAGSRYINAQQYLYNSRFNPGQYNSVVIIITFGIILLIAGAAHAMDGRNARKFEVPETKE
jgi:putative spermidine/putrescine transport system permease protein